MLSEKRAEYIFNVQHPSTGEKRFIELDQFLNPIQIRAMAGRPNLILEFAHMLNSVIQKNAKFDPIVTAKIKISLNNSRTQYFFDQTKDLSLIPLNTPAYLWIYPLK